MVSDLRTAAKDSGTAEMFVAEFGVVSSRYFDPSKNYHGRLYRMNADLQKSLCEAMGFAAKFDLPAIRTAYMDVFQTEGHVVFEIERNTKPGDINVRYARDRWNVQDLSGKSSEGLRPWIKSEYHARFLDDRARAALAELLKLRMDDASRCLMRLNFRDRTYGIIGEDRFAEQFPAGAYTWFNLPTAQMQAIQTNDELEDYAPQQELFQSTEYGGNEPAGASNMDSNFKADPTTTATEQETKMEGQDTTAATATTETPVTTAVETSAHVSPEPAEERPEPSSTAAVANTREDSQSEKQDAPARKQPDSFFTKQEPSRRPTATVERTERPTYNSAPAAPAPASAPTRRDSAAEQPKYATYSKSEIDYMLKQQADQILIALSSKVAAQQRGFQEAITAQEKAFNRIAENFTTHFDEARIKLEHTTRTAHESTHRELDDFHKQFSKELEQYRTQINKVVLPVAKALEDPNKLKQQQKEVARQEQPAQKGGGSNANLAVLQKQLKIAIAAAIASAVIALLSGITTVLSIADIKQHQTAAATSPSDASQPGAK